jgi:hypothetical protein
MKKRNGPSAGIPRPSGERSSPVSNVPREVRYDSFPPFLSESFLFFFIAAELSWNHVQLQVHILVGHHAVSEGSSVLGEPEPSTR